MYWALTTDLVDTRGHDFEQVLGDIQTLNQWARCGRLEVHELHEVVAGEIPGRQSDDDIVVFKSNGLAAWDVALGAEAVRLAREQGVGTEL